MSKRRPTDTSEASPASTSATAFSKSVSITEAVLDMSAQPRTVNPEFFTQSLFAFGTDSGQHARFGPAPPGTAMNTQHGSGPQVPAVSSPDFQQDFTSQPMAHGMSTDTDLLMGLFGNDARAALPPSRTPMPNLTGDALPGTCSSQGGFMACFDADGNALAVGIDPASYINGINEWHHEQSRLVSAGTYPPPDQACRNMMPSAPPSMVSGLSAFEPPQPLTRQNSFWDCRDDVYMTRNASSQSYHADGVSFQDVALQLAKDDALSISPTSSSELFSMNLDSMPDSGYAAFPIDNAMFLSPPTSHPMKRSDSNPSYASARSSASDPERSLRDTLTKQLGNGKMTKIRPKLASTSTPKLVASSLGHGTKGKVRLQPRIPYRRPRGPKVFCAQCNEQPEGFRGDHELRRHVNGKHKVVVKKFVCRDPASVGLSSAVSVLQPLSECKACSSHKEYGTDYNAAAHLRRTHFKPKAPRGSNKKPDDEKRGGMGGGSWPPMAELKLWIGEISVVCGGNGR
ncbi:hypothetical protein E4U21_006406 [Claviceps maximensis]|nr:hypothetical protein E4U21_006406 [Claviceps maximensis]